MQSIHIREAGSQDLAALLALYGQPEVDNGQVLTLEQATAMLSRFRSYPSYKLYVALMGERLVGTFTLLIVENLAHQGAPTGVVEDVVVAVDCQRQGIGKQMMRFALERCRDAGCYKMALSSNARRAAAHRFYESLGFVQHGFSFVADLEGSGRPEKR
jgi:GNAT superfamily N-acetyltransferase